MDSDDDFIGTIGDDDEVALAQESTDTDDEVLYNSLNIFLSEPFIKH